MKTDRSIFRSFILTSALLLAMPLSAQAFGGGHGRHGGHGAGMMADGPRMMLRSLDLTDAQQKQLRDLRDQHQDATLATRRALRDERIALRDLMRADKYDAERAGQVSERIGKLQGQLLKARADGHGKMLSILTPEQRATLKKRQEERAQRSPGERQGQRFGGGGWPQG